MNPRASWEKSPAWKFPKDYGRFHYNRTWETTISLWNKESVISHGICCVIHSSRNNDVYECLLLHFDTKFCKRRQFCGVKQVFFTTHLPFATNMTKMAGLKI